MRSERDHKHVALVNTHTRTHTQRTAAAAPAAARHENSAAPQLSSYTRYICKNDATLGAIARLWARQRAAKIMRNEARHYESAPRIASEPPLSNTFYGVFYMQTCSRSGRSCATARVNLI
jgi:hypothetical protein